MVLFWRLRLAIQDLVRAVFWATEVFWYLVQGVFSSAEVFWYLVQAVFYCRVVVLTLVLASPSTRVIETSNRSHLGSGLSSCHLVLPFVPSL